VYPLSAKRLRIEGVVQLEAVVKPDGLPAAVRIVTSSGQASLDESALSTVRSRWRFIPARQGNTPIESSVVFSIRFELDDG
jgi:protein TonB